MLAFAHLRKTAGTTMLSILRRNFGTRLFESRKFAAREDFSSDDLNRVRLLYRRLDCIAGEQLTPSGDLYAEHPELRFFTFLRNPISRCVSNFQWHLNCRAKYHYPGVPANFVREKWRVPSDLKACARQWLAKRQANLQTQRLAGCQSLDRAKEILTQRVGFVGLVERYNESLIMWREWTGISNLQIAYRAKNVSAKGRFGAPLVLKQLMAEDPTIARLVTECNEIDQQLYEFVCTELYPAQLSRYEQALRSTDESALVLPPGFDANTLNAARRWVFRSLIYKPLRPLLFRAA